MMKKYYYIHEGLFAESIINDIINNNYKDVVMVADTEWEWRLPDIFYEIIHNSNIKVQFVFGSFCNDLYLKRSKQYNLPIENYHFWSTLWFNWGEELFRNVIDYTGIAKNQILYPFICLNGKAHSHRASMIDNMTKLNLLDKGVVTWNKQHTEYNVYPFKYYDNSIRSINDNFKQHDHSFIICNEYSRSLLDIVGEATIEVPFITEKTTKPLLLKRPFVNLGCVNFSQYLKNLGFELYTEIIDYSFDTIEDMEQRSSALIQQLIPITLETDLNGLYDKLYPKILHNYNRTLEIINDKNFIPEIIIEMCRHTNSRYNYFLRNAL